jgi:hypothetical protein
MRGRRSVIGAGLLAGLGAATAASAAGAEQRRGESDTADAIEEVTKAIRELRTADDPGSGAVERIRQHQRQFLKGQQKFPDFLDVGIQVWENLYDWHVKFQQPLNISRQPDGRYVMAFTQTLLVLRPEQSDTYISLPYDRA